jgi:Ca-activated chloride channel family protein
VAAARAAKAAHVPISTVALGTANGTIRVRKRGGGTRVVPVPPDPAVLAQIAQASGGRAYTAQSASGLGAVYQQLGSRLSHRNERKQITSTVAGAGLALMLAAAGLSLAWFGRLI